MKLQEPITLYVHKNKAIALFKIENNKYLLFNGIQSVEMIDGFEDEYITLNNESAIPFILVHNMRIDIIVNELKNTGRGGKHRLIVSARNSRIENELNTNLTVHDIYHEYNNGIITYDELHLWLIIDTQRKWIK